MSSKSRKLIRTEWPKIRRVTIRGKSFFQVDARKTGTSGKQESFSTQGEAETRAQEIAGDTKTGGTVALDMPAALRTFALQADELLKPYGKTILHAAEHYKAFLDAKLTKDSSKLIPELADAWLAFKRSGDNAELSEHTIDGIKKGRDFLVKHFAKFRIMEPERKDFEKILNSCGYSLRTKHNMKSLVSQFYNWAIEKEFCLTNPVAKIEYELGNRDSVEILAVERAQEFMELCQNNAKYNGLTLYHALGLFGGLRPFEAQKITWENINLDTGFIYVSKKISKIKDDRNVPIEANLRAWLEGFKGDRKGFVTRQMNFSNLIKSYRADMGYRMVMYKQVNLERVRVVRNPDADGFPQDVMRHSYGSYWLALHKDRPHLAENMGNSVEVIKNHYKKIVSPLVAKRFFAIFPKGYVPIEAKGAKVPRKLKPAA